MTDAAEFLSAAEVRALLAEAKELRDQAAADRKTADETLAAAKYLHGQAQFHNREATEKIAAVQRREAVIAQYAEREAALAAREKAVEERERRCAERCRLTTATSTRPCKCWRAADHDRKPRPPYRRHRLRRNRRR